MAVHLLPQAVDDLEEFYEPLRSEILDRLEILSEFPNAGVAMTQEFTGYRCLVISRLVRVVYTVRNEKVWVAYIRHSARQIKK